MTCHFACPVAVFVFMLCRFLVKTSSLSFGRWVGKLVGKAPALPSTHQMMRLRTW